MDHVTPCTAARGIRHYNHEARFSSEDDQSKLLELRSWNAAVSHLHPRPIDQTRLLLCMAIASQLPQHFLALRRLLLHLFKPLRGLIPRALRRILGRLAFIWSILRTKLGFRQKGIGKPPSSSQDDKSRMSKARKDGTQSKHKEQAEISRLESGSTSYTLIEQGEIISLDDAAFSAYPFPGNIRATRSTHSLANSHRSAHNLAISVNNGSRSSQHLGSEHSYHSGNSNYSNSVHSGGRTTTGAYLNKPSRDFPGWQQSTPIPHRQHTISTPNLEVISPIEDMSPTGNGEVDSLRVPTRSATPVIMPLNESRISPRMPEAFSGRRYDDRPRM
jgi:hypothetical protein